MHVPRYWAVSEAEAIGDDDDRFPVRCWGWSDQSLDEAKQKAAARAAEMTRKLLERAGLERYPYGNGERPLREEVVPFSHAGLGDGSALITRNQYGALVLNTAKVMFIDVDFETHAKAQPSGGFLRRLFHKPTAADMEKSSLEQIHEWANGRSDLGMRLYRTLAGIRCLVTNRTFEPASAECTELLQSIGSDPLYVRLCKGQGSFRARLTPKPWRCGSWKMEVGYPRVDAGEEERFQKWKAQYEKCCGGFGVCRFMEETGPTARHPAAEPIVGLHDQFTIGAGDAPLA